MNTWYFFVHFLVTIQCRLFLLERVFSIFTLEKCKHYTLHGEPFFYSQKKMYKIMSIVHGLGVLTVNQLLKTIMALLIPSPHMPLPPGDSLSQRAAWVWGI